MRVAKRGAAMRNRPVREFALRKGHESSAPRRVAGLLSLFSALALCGSLGACAEDSKYPSLSKITDLTDILSPEDRKKALEDMQKQEQTHGADAAKAIEKPGP